MKLCFIASDEEGNALFGQRVEVPVGHMSEIAMRLAAERWFEEEKKNLCDVCIAEVSTIGIYAYIGYTPVIKVAGHG